MSDSATQVYLELCREMREWPKKLAVLLKDAPPIGLHFFVWRSLPTPGTLSCTMKLGLMRKNLRGTSFKLRTKVLQPKRLADRRNGASCQGAWDATDSLHQCRPIVWMKSWIRSSRRLSRRA